MNLFRDISIRIRVLIPPAVLILALAAVSLLAIYGLSVQQVALAEVQEIALEKITVIDEFAALSERVQSDVFQISVLRSMDVPEEEIQPIYEHLDQGLSDLDIIYGQIVTKWSLDQAERSILEQMSAPMVDFRQQALQAATVISSDPFFGVLMVRSSTAPFAEFRDVLAEFRSYQQEKIVRTQTMSAQRTARVSIVLIAVTVSITLGGILAAALISTHSISRPIRSITHLMRRLAGGDLSIAAQDRDRGDEIGAMAQAVEVFRNNALEKARLDEALRASEERYRTLFETSPNAVLVQADGKVVLANPAALQILGADSEQDLVGKAVTDLIHPDYQDMVQERIQAIYEERGTAELVEGKFIRLDGQVIDVEVAGEIVDYQGKPASQAVFRDISKRKRAEQQIQETLAEKEVLLREVHHRVKNNLQSLIFLIDMQSETIRDSEILRALTDLQGRVRAMAVIHEKLYQSEDLSRIDFGEYLEELIPYLLYALGANRPISLRIEVKDVLINVNQAIPCGLIVNELVTNALQHAFPALAEGATAGFAPEIVVGLEQQGDEYLLAVSDNGAGLPETLDWPRTESLGLKLVNIWATYQLRGSIEVDTRPGPEPGQRKGTTFRIRFSP